MLNYTPTQLVDIHYSNVPDWLIANNLVPPKNENSGTTPQDVINIDIQFAKLHFTENKVAGVPPEITHMLKGEISYVDAMAIFSFLEQSEGTGSARNVFGLFKTEALKSWWTLLRSWEKGNLHLSHASTILVRHLSQDEPNLQRKYQAAERTVRTIDNRYVPATVYPTATFHLVITNLIRNPTLPAHPTDRTLKL